MEVRNFTVRVELTEPSPEKLVQVDDILMTMEFVGFTTKKDSDRSCLFRLPSGLYEEYEESTSLREDIDALLATEGLGEDAVLDGSSAMSIAALFMRPVHEVQRSTDWQRRIPHRPLTSLCNPLLVFSALTR